MFKTIERILNTSLEDFTWPRLRNAFLARINDIPDKIAWYSKNKYARRNKEKLLLYKDRHVGKRCFIIGNGPSLRRMDLFRLKDEITFGLNRIYLYFETMGFQPTYFVSMEDNLLKQFHHEIDELTMPKFVNWKYRNYFQQQQNIALIKHSFRPKFETDLTRPNWSGATVTYNCMQIAYYMGFKEVILIGVDHNFSADGYAGQAIVANESDPNHFDPNYFPKGCVWRLPDYVTMEMGYRMAKDAFEADGREIIDATLDGKLKIFRKTEYESIF